MFEKYTERAVFVVTTAQDIAKNFKHKTIEPEHILLSLAQNSCGICSKLFSLYKINYENLSDDVQKFLSTSLEDSVNPTFSEETISILNKVSQAAQMFGSKSVLIEHIFYVLLNESENISKLLCEKGFDVDNAKKVLLKLLSKKTKPHVVHPEDAENFDSESMPSSVISMLDEDKTKAIFQNALSKLSTTGYEILGTEQIFQSILDSNSEMQKILQNAGITIDKFNEKLKTIQSRQDEFCGRQIIFTPNAFKSVILAIEIAKELGSAELKPEHIILGILKNRSGIAYNLIKSFDVDTASLSDKIEKSVGRELNETLMILKFAKEEAFRIGTNVVGTEMILLGIIIESYGVGARTLAKLGITLNDVRNEVSKIIKNVDNDFELDLIFSKRAKKVLEIAWEFAQKYNKTSINSEDLLMGIINLKSCIAMQVLTNLGVDIVEIKQGILNEIKNV